MGGSPKPALEPRLLETIAFPTDKSVLLIRAREINAPDAVRVAIGHLRSGPFQSRDELVAAIEMISSP
jgi:hypothetical protein